MRHTISDETIEELDRLVSELRAIGFWDTAYRRNLSPEFYETVAFATRQKRRREILRQLQQLSHQIQVAHG